MDAHTTARSTTARSTTARSTIVGATTARRGWKKRAAAIALTLGVFALPAFATPANAQVTTTTMPTGVPAGFQTTAVQFLTVTKSGDSNAVVSWVPPQIALTPIVSYRVSAVTDSATALPKPSLYTVNANVLNVTFKNLSLGHTYFFQVQPVTATGSGAPSELSAPVAITDGSERKPYAPTGINVTLVGSGQALVAWTSPAPRPNVTINKYRVTTFPSTRTVDVGAPNTSAVIGSLKAGVTYYVQVQAISTENKYSDPGLSAPVPIPLPAPAPTVPPTPAPTTATTTTTTLPLALPSPVAVPALAAAARCTSRAWSPSLLGQPVKLQAGAPSGIYIWTDGRAIQMRTYNNANTPVRFSGSVTANTTMPTARFYTEAEADTVSIGRTAASFSFSSAYDLDALRFDGRCVRSVTFRLFLNGQPIPPSQIFLGAEGINPTTSAFVLSR